MTDEWLEDRALPETYDLNHPHYYCYLKNCRPEEMRGFLDHRGIETKEDYPPTLLVALLRQDDEAIKSGKRKIKCNCCVEGQDDYDPDDNQSHFGCEHCPPHTNEGNEG